MYKHIGIIGVSSEGAVLSCKTICEEGFNKLGKYIHPEITLHTLPLIEYMNCIEQEDWNRVTNFMDLNSSGEIKFQKFLKAG